MNKVTFKRELSHDCSKLLTKDQSFLAYLNRKLIICRHLLQAYINFFLPNFFLSFSFSHLVIIIYFIVILTVK